MVSKKTFSLVIICLLGITFSIRVKASNTQAIVKQNVSVAKTDDGLPTADYIVDHRLSPHAQRRPLPFDEVQLTKSFERPPWAGFYTNSRNEPIDTKQFPFIKGVTDRIKWQDVEPAENQYDWSKMDNNIRNAVKGGYYYYFVLWTGPHSPDWIYEKGVPRVKTVGGQISDFPYYLSPNYINYFHQFIGELANHIASLSESERKAIAFIQPAFGSTGDRQLYKGRPSDPQYKINDQQYLDFCSKATTCFYEAFDKPQLRQIKFLFNIADEMDTEENENESAQKKSQNGEQLYANWIREHYKIELRKQQFTTAVGYQANNEIIQDDKQRPSFFGLNGKAPDLVRGEFSKFAEGDIFKENPIWNYYWTAISTVDRGLDLWEVDYKVVKTGLYNEAFDFANKYAYYKQAQSSPYAFIALRDVLDAADTERFTEDDYGVAKQNNEFRIRKIENDFASCGAKVGDLSAATKLSGSKYLLEAKAMNDVGYQLINRNYGRFITQIEANMTSIGWWRVGPIDQPYGRYARGFENASGRNRMFFDIDDHFLPKIVKNNSVEIKIIYLDEGTGKFTFRYDALTNPDKTATVITKTNSKRWVVKIITLQDAVFANRGPKSSDFSLVNEDTEDDLFHLIEVTKKL
jgi:hypothetical protein